MTSHNDEVPLALARMLPHGRAAQAAARLLANNDIIEDALDTVARFEGHGGLNHTALTQALAAVADFRKALADEAAYAETHPACAPLTGTSSRSIVDTIANSILMMPEPRGEDGGWREAAYRQVHKTGSNYAQVWRKDATYWTYTRQSETGGN